MPRYVYKAVEGKGCPVCREGFSTFQGFWDDPYTVCPKCCGDIYRSIQRPRFRFTHSFKTDYEYREDLARTPEEIVEQGAPPGWEPGMPDPEAFTDGPRAVEKLLNKRLRQGWQLTERKVEGPRMKSNQELVEEAFEAAKDKGFRTSDDD